MKKKIICLAAFILAFNFKSLSEVKAEIVNSLVVEGNTRVTEETIAIYGKINIGENYNESNLNEILTNLYSTDLFQNVKVSLKNNILKIIVEEYPIINEIIIVGEKRNSISEQIKKLIQLKEKRSFIKSFLVSDIDIIKKLYSSIGYNFAEVEIKVNEFGNNKLDLLIDIKRGNLSKIKSISFIGDKKIRSNRLKDITASEEHKFWKILSKNTKFNQNLINLDLRLLENYYKSIGYYNVKVVSQTANLKEDGNIDLIYSIDAGDRFIINKIITNPDPVLDKAIFIPLKEKFKKVIGEYYSPFTVKKLLEDIDELIAKNNLQFIEHNVEEIVSGKEITIKFNIFEGEKVLVERINILGNNVTNENVIRSELLLDEGDPYTNLAIEKSIAKIKSRNIFGDVQYNVKTGSKNDLKIIDVKVEERPTGEISAGAGIGTDGGTIAFDISENNWLGEGKRVKFGMELDEETVTGELNYSNPNYDFLGNAINYYLSSSSNDKPDQGYENTIISSGVGTSFEQYKDVYTSLGLAFSYDDLRTDGSASASLKKQSGEFSEIAANYGIRYDKRNRAFMPTKGSIINFGQTIPIYADAPFIGNTFAISTYKELNENVVGASKLFLTSIHGINNEDVRISKRKNLSSNRLRGFKRNKVGPKDGSDHVGGNYAASLNFEANLPNLLPESSKADVSAFLDFGNIWGVDYDKTIDESNKLRSSTGVALNWMSPLGPISFVLSTNLSKASTDETESFKFNLGTTF